MFTSTLPEALASPLYIGLELRVNMMLWFWNVLAHPLKNSSTIATAHLA